MVVANFFTLIETGCAIGYHRAVIVKNDFNADSIYIGKIVYGVSMICLKVFLLFNAIFVNIGFMNWLIEIPSSYINFFLFIILGWRPFWSHPICADYRTAKNCLIMQRRLKEITVEEGEEICSICHCPMVKGVKIQCGHVFHRLCLLTWFNTQQDGKLICPYCRTSLN